MCGQMMQGQNTCCFSPESMVEMLYWQVFWLALVEPFPWHDHSGFVSAIV
jgi:hypothetical protein